MLVVLWSLISRPSKYLCMCVCVSVCVRIYVYIYIYICICVNTYIYTCAYIYIHIYMYIYMYAYIYIYMYMYICICIYKCTRICICVNMYKYICIYRYAYILLHICVYLYMYKYTGAHTLCMVCFPFLKSLFFCVFSYINNILCTASRFQHWVGDHTSSENTFLHKMYLFKKCMSLKNKFLQKIIFPDLSIDFKNTFL